jgi:hypothetical protein
MVPHQHTAIWHTAQGLKAKPITRPFKPIAFLRLVDQLLHQQLDRYRRLAQILTGVLTGLQAQTGGLCAFLVEDDGQILIANGEVEDVTLEILADLAILPYSSNTHPPKVSSHKKTLYDYPNFGQAYGLYITSVTENLHLALVLPKTAENQIRRSG